MVGRSAVCIVFCLEPNFLSKAILTSCAISCGRRCWILPKSATLRRMPHSEIEVHCMKLTACKMALRKLTLKEFALLWFFSSKLTLFRPRRGNHRSHFYHKIFQCIKLLFFFWILYHKSKSNGIVFFPFIHQALLFDSFFCAYLLESFI